MLERRLNAFKNEMQGQGLDGSLIVNEANLLYLSGFTGGEGYIIINRDKQVLITDSRYTEQASLECPDYEIIEFKGDALSKVSEVISSLGIEKLGFEENHTNYADYLNYQKKITAELVPMSGIVDKMRARKDSMETEKIRKAVEIADKAFEHILEFIKPGVAEKEIAAELEYFMKKSGAHKESFDTIVASGPRSSMPHGVASERKIGKGDAITLDFGAIYEGYCSDITRTVFLGEPDARLKDIYSIVLEAQLKAIEYIAAGKSGKDTDAVAREVIAGKGYGDYFGHGLGHGVGLFIHEAPRLSPFSSSILEEDMVVTVEPGIYIAGLGGVRIEDVVIVGKESCEILTKSRKDLIML